MSRIGLMNQIKQYNNETFKEKQKKSINCPKYNQYKTYLYYLQHGFPAKCYNNEYIKMINNNYTYEDNDESSSNRSSILLSPNNDSSINENKMSFLDTSNSPSPTTPQALYFYNP